MNLIETIKTRRSVRAYQPTPIGEEALGEILEAGLYAPSGVNLQPWYLVAMRSEAQMTRLAQVMNRVGERVEPELKERFPNHPAVVTQTTKFIREMGGAPACILVFHLKPGYDDTSRAISIAVGAAVQNMMLAATEKGIGSCCLTAPVEAGVGDELRDAFAPGKGPLAALITLGYPAQEPKAPPRKDGRSIIL